MSDRPNTNHYAYRVVWSAEDNEYVGLVEEFPFLSWLNEDQREAFDGIQRLVNEVVGYMIEDGETPPVPKAERHYSGKFMVRTDPDVHRDLAEQAARRNVSLNAVVNEKLGGKAKPRRKKTKLDA